MITNNCKSVLTPHSFLPTPCLEKKPSLGSCRAPWGPILQNYFISLVLLLAMTDNKNFIYIPKRRLFWPKINFLVTKVKFTWHIFLNDDAQPSPTPAHHSIIKVEGRHRSIKIDDRHIDLRRSTIRSSKVDNPIIERWGSVHTEYCPLWRSILIQIEVHTEHHKNHYPAI